MPSRIETKEKPRRSSHRLYGRDTPSQPKRRRDTDKPHERECHRGPRRERGIAITIARDNTPKDTRRLTSVPQPTPPPLLLILIIGTATVPQASVSRHKLKPQTAPPNIYSLEHSNSEGKAVRRRKTIEKPYGPMSHRGRDRELEAGTYTREESLARMPNVRETHLEPKGPETEEPVENLE
jgi:hypothetical protein